MRLRIGEPLPEQAVPVRRHVADGDIGLATMQIAEVIGRQDHDGELWRLPPDAGQNIGHHIGRIGIGRRYAHPATKLLRVADGRQGHRLGRFGHGSGLFEQ